MHTSSKPWVYVKTAELRTHIREHLVLLELLVSVLVIPVVLELFSSVLLELFSSVVLELFPDARPHCRCAEFWYLPKSQLRNALKQLAAQEQRDLRRKHWAVFAAIVVGAVFIFVFHESGEVPVADVLAAHVSVTFPQILLNFIFYIILCILFYKLLFAKHVTPYHLVHLPNMQPFVGTGLQRLSCLPSSKVSKRRLATRRLANSSDSASSMLSTDHALETMHTTDMTLSEILPSVGNIKDGTTVAYYA